MTLDVALTLKLDYTLINPYAHADTVLYEFYEAYLERMRGKGFKFLEHVYEKDDKGIVHLHGIVRMPKCYGNLTYGPEWDSRYHEFTLPGLHIKLNKITSLANWKTYMYMDNKKTSSSDDGSVFYFRPGLSVKPLTLKSIISRAWDYYAFLIDHQIATLLAYRDQPAWLTCFLADDKIILSKTIDLIELS